MQFMRVCSNEVVFKKDRCKFMHLEGGMKRIQLQNRELWFSSGCNLSHTSISSSEGQFVKYSLSFSLFLPLHAMFKWMSLSPHIPFGTEQTRVANLLWVWVWGVGFGVFLCKCEWDFILFSLNYILICSRRKEWVISLQSQHYKLTSYSASQQLLENLLQPKQSDFVIEFGWCAVKDIRSEMRKGCLSLVEKKPLKNKQNHPKTFYIPLPGV